MKEEYIKALKKEIETKDKLIKDLSEIVTKYEYIMRELKEKFKL